MPLIAPNLDDRQFADIVAEAKTLIPRYAPEWTNFNETDPGITLVELFAWMTEILIYRLNQVPDRNYIKFLQLIGIELQPAQPARAELTFTLARPDISTVIVPLGTQVAAQGSTGQPVVFETDQALIAIGAQLTQIETFDGFGYTLQTKKNAAQSQWFYPFGPKPQPGNALLLGFSSPKALPTEQINLAVSLFQDGLTPPVMKCATAIPPPAALIWEYFDGAQWQLINIDSDGTRAFSQAGHILFPGPGNLAKAAPKSNIFLVDGLYWIRARVQSASYEMPPQISAIRTNSISATQAITFTDEVLGTSNGLPNQTFQVANTSVMVLDTPIQVTNSDGVKVSVTSLRLEIDEGQGFMAWQEVDDFFSSGPNDRVFTIDRNIGVITTGTGNMDEFRSSIRRVQIQTLSRDPIERAEAFREMWQLIPSPNYKRPFRPSIPLRITTLLPAAPTKNPLSTPNSARLSPCRAKIARSLRMIFNTLRPKRRERT